MNKLYSDFSSLAVSGQCCSGKSTLCRVLSKKLNWTHVDVGNEFRKIAKIKGYRNREVWDHPDKLLRQYMTKCENYGLKNRRASRDESPSLALSE